MLSEEELLNKMSKALESFRENSNETPVIFLHSKYKELYPVKKFYNLYFEDVLVEMRDDINGEFIICVPPMYRFEALKEKEEVYDE